MKTHIKFAARTVRRLKNLTTVSGLAIALALPMAQVATAGQDITFNIEQKSLAQALADLSFPGMNNDKVSLSSSAQWQSRR